MKPRIAIIHGEPAGIGPELIGKLLDQPDVSDHADIVWLETDMFSSSVNDRRVPNGPFGKLVLMIRKFGRRETVIP